MNIDEFIAEFKAENSMYDSTGLIDEASLVKWFIDALEPFGMNIMQLSETVISIDNSTGELPDNFYSLYIAYKCDKKGYFTKAKDKSEIQNSYMWTERIERSHKWQTCEPCCSTDEEKIIVEKFYINDIETQFYYHKPVLLRLGKSMIKSKCYDKCRNLYVKDCLYEIVINNKTIYTNFDEGDIYMQYYGTPVDSEGKFLIPDVGKGELKRYVEYYVHLKFFEKLLKNSDDTNIATLFQYYVQKENSQKGLALTDTKFARLTPNSFKKLKNANRKEMLQYECMFPQI